MILVYAITPIHVGAGRSVGIVDLPIQRDAIGYPVIFSSSFKGALKAYCGKDAINKDGRIDCPDLAKEESQSDKTKAEINPPNPEKLGVALCCCAFGSEPLGSSSETGILTLTDLIPFAVPVPAEKNVYLYLTSPYLLRKISDVLDAEVKSLDKYTKKANGSSSSVKDERLEFLKGFSELVSSILKALPQQHNTNIQGNLDTIVTISEEKKERIFVDNAFHRIKIDRQKIAEIDKKLKEETLNEKLREELENKLKVGKVLEALNNLGALTSNIEDKLIIIPDDDRYLFDKATLKVTRNRISLNTKTVAEGALWTEEYLPEGTIFVGGYLINDRVNNYCEYYKKQAKLNDIFQVVESLKEERFSNGEFYLSLGGKETIGKGLVKVRWW